MEGRKLTYAELEQHGACPESRELFERAFGEEVIVTVELALSQSQDWDWYWAANHLLFNPEEWNSVNEDAGAEFRKVMQPFWEEYDAVVHAARVERQLALDALPDKILVDRLAIAHRKEVYQKYAEQTRDVYEKMRAAEDTHRRVFENVRARKFAELFIKEGVSDGV